MTDIFISYARSTAPQAQQIAEALRALGYGVWRDDELPAHRAYAEVIEERLQAARAVVVIWSAEAAKSQWVFSEANRAREDGKLIQLRLDDTRLPMPFDTIQCADLSGWTGDVNAPGWRKVADSIAAVAGSALTATPAITAPLALPTKPSIAVMPFANLSGDPEQEYFADGMVEEITTALSKIRSLFVVGSRSGLSFKGRDVSAQDAGGAMGVHYVLEGSVRKSGNRVRISVKLIDATDGSQVWADRFEDTLDDIFELQDRIAVEAAARIDNTIQVAEIRRAIARPIANASVYDLYLRAFSIVRAYQIQAFGTAIGLLETAIALDPDNARVLAVFSFCHMTLRNVGSGNDRDFHHRTAVAACRQALKFAGDDSDILASCGQMLANLEGVRDEAIELIDRALAINPGAQISWHFSGWVRLYFGETDLAIEHLEKAIRLDPLSPDRSHVVLGLAQAAFFQRRFADTLSLITQTLQNWETVWEHAFAAASCAYLGREAQASEAWAQVQALGADTFLATAPQLYHDPDNLRLLLDGVALAERMAAEATDR